MIRRLAILLGVLLTLAATTASSATTSPSIEQLVAAGLTAKDMNRLKVSPEEWSDTEPGLTGPINYLDPEAGFLTYATTGQMAWPAEGHLEAYSAVSLFSDAETAAAAFRNRLKSDEEDSGPEVPGEKLAEDTRYHIKAPLPDQEGMASIRVRHGRYLALVRFSGTLHLPSQAQLKPLAELIVSRIDQLEAGTLPMPPLPPLARQLPAADAEVGPVLATVPVNAESFVWTTRDGEQVPSAELKELLRKGADGEASVRIYHLPGQEGHVALVSLLAFRDIKSMTRYVTQSSLNGKQVEEGLSLIAPDKSTDLPVWRAILSEGRVSAEVQCWHVNSEEISASCEGIVLKLAQRMRNTLKDH